MVDRLTKASGLNTDQWSFTPTGDGFLLAVYDNRVNSQPDLLVRFAVELRQAHETYNIVKDSEGRYSVRIGLHRGDFYYEQNLLSHITVIGDGPNRVSRVCGIGDGEHIIASEAFHSHLIQYHPELSSQFRPLGAVYVRHGDAITAHQYIGERGTEVEQPKIIRWGQSVLKQIRKELLAVLDTTARALGKIPGKDADVLAQQLRATVLLRNRPTTEHPFGFLHLPRDMWKFLRAMQPSPSGTPNPTYARYCQETQATFSLELGREAGIGASAYNMKTARWTAGLPKFDDNPQQYSDALNAQLGIHTTVPEVQTWRRKARAFIAVPLRADTYFDGDEDAPGGVLCLDCDEPLVSPATTPENDYLRVATEDIAARHGNALVYLLRLMSTRSL